MRTSTMEIDICCKGLLDVPGDVNISVTELILASNQIRWIEGPAFHGLLILEILDLNFNQVTYISPKAFRSNHVLRRINLIDHRLMAIPENFGEAADSLEILAMKVLISKHILQRVNLTGYPRLWEITFSNAAPANGIFTLKNLPRMTALYAEHCALTSFPNLSEAPNLWKASLHTGFFTSIPQEQLARSTRLQYLNRPGG